VVGDLIALYLRSDLIRPGEMPVIVKRLVSRIPHFCTFPYTPKRGDDCVPVVTCASTNPRQRIHISAAKLMASAFSRTAEFDRYRSRCSR
jgi:hypothetical protein